MPIVNFVHTSHRHTVTPSHRTAPPLHRGGGCCPQILQWQGRGQQHQPGRIHSLAVSRSLAPTTATNKGHQHGTRTWSESAPQSTCLHAISRTLMGCTLVCGGSRSLVRAPATAIDMYAAVRSPLIPMTRSTPATTLAAARIRGMVGVQFRGV